MQKAQNRSYIHKTNTNPIKFLLGIKENSFIFLIKALENKPLEEKNHAIITKSTFSNDSKQEKIPEKNTDKEKESFVQAKDSQEKSTKDPLKKPKDSLEKPKDPLIKPQDSLKDPLIKPKDFPKDSLTKTTFKKPDAINKPVINPKLGNFPMKKPEENEDEEEKKTNNDKNSVPIVKNQDFKNKLESLFKAGGNPMRMNDDCCSALRKKKSIAPVTRANGKRASKTFGNLFFFVIKNLYFSYENIVFRGYFRY